MMMVSIHKQQCVRTLLNPPIIILYVWFKSNPHFRLEVGSCSSGIFVKIWYRTSFLVWFKRRTLFSLGAPAFIQCIRTLSNLYSIHQLTITLFNNVGCIIEYEKHHVGCCCIKISRYMQNNKCTHITFLQQLLLLSYAHVECC